MEIIKHTGGRCGGVLVKDSAIYKKWINEWMTALKLDMENVCYTAGAQKRAKSYKIKDCLPICLKKFFWAGLLFND